MMQIKTQETEILGEKFVLCNQRVLYWPQESALIISDLHVGKTAHFRKNGIAIPNDSLQRDLLRLETLLAYFSAKKIIITGDLLHAGDNTDVDLFCKWRNQFADTEFHLIEGNHDRLNHDLEKKLCLNSRQNVLKIRDFYFVHEFESGFDGFQITGHIHPGYVIKTKIKNYRLPCFALTQNQLLLPAFSEFTGLDTVNLPQNAKFFPFSKQQIFDL